MAELCIPYLNVLQIQNYLRVAYEYLQLEKSLIAYNAYMYAIKWTVAYIQQYLTENISNIKNVWTCTP